MSRWTHSICLDCWKKKYSGRAPIKIRPEEGQSLPAEGCCFCGQDTYEGIYIRDDPDSLLCSGVHEGDD